MKLIKNIGLVLCFIGFFIFTASIFTGTNKVSQETFNTWASSKIKSEFFIKKAQTEIVGKELSAHKLSSTIISIAKESDAYEMSQENIDWGKIIKVKWNTTSKNLVYPLVRESATGWVPENKGLFFLLTFGLAIIGGLMAFGADYKLLGPAGIKNNGIFQHSATNRGVLGMIACIYFVSFYIFLYFFPNYLTNPILAVDNIIYIDNKHNSLTALFTCRLQLLCKSSRPCNDYLIPSIYIPCVNKEIDHECVTLI